MFIVFENNPQLYNLADGLKLFNDVDQAARYARNRGFLNPLAPTLDSLKLAVDSPGKGISGGAPVVILLANVDAVDPAANAAPPVNVELEALRLNLVTLNNEKLALEAQVKDVKISMSEAVNAVAVQLEQSEAKVAELEGKLKVQQDLLDNQQKALEATAAQKATSKKAPAAAPAAAEKTTGA